MDQETLDRMRATLAEYDKGKTSGWAKPSAPAAAGGVLGVNVPIKVQTPDGGSVRCYLVLGAEAAASPDALMQALGALHAAGVPLDIYTPKPAWGGGGGGNGNGYRGGNGGGGWSQRRGW